MTIAEFTRYVFACLEVHNFVEVDDTFLLKVFEQKERRTPLGDAIMSFCDLPTEKQCLESWLAANELEIVRNVQRLDWIIRKKDNGRSNVH